MYLHIYIYIYIHIHIYMYIYIYTLIYFTYMFNSYHLQRVHDRLNAVVEGSVRCHNIQNIQLSLHFTFYI